MRTSSKLLLASLGCATMLWMAGCPQPPENEITWGIKAVRGQLTTTTATEWQAVATKVDEAVPEADLTLTQVEAQAIVDFLKQYELDSQEDINAFIAQVEQDPGSVEIPPALLNMFGDAAAAAVVNQLGG